VVIVTHELPNPQKIAGCAGGLVGLRSSYYRCRVEKISCSWWCLDTELSGPSEVIIPPMLYEPLSGLVEKIKLTLVCSSFLCVYIYTVSHYYPIEYLYL